MSTSRRVAALATFALLGVAALASAALGEAAPTPPPAIQVAGSTPVSIGHVAQPITVRLINGPEAQTVYAAPDGGSIAVGFGGSPTCAEPPASTTTSAGTAAPGATATTSTTIPAAVPLGNVGRGQQFLLQVIACGKDEDLRGATAHVSVWGSSGAGVLRIPVQLGSAPNAPTNPTTLQIRSAAGDTEATKDVCLASPVTGTVGFVTRNASVEPVTLATTPDPDKKCALPTLRVKITAKLAHGAGAYSGTIDVNGSADGGTVTLTVNQHYNVIWFFLLLVLGFIAATLLSWWARFGRDWGQVDTTEAQLRFAVSTAQKEALAAGGGDERWKVVSDGGRVTPPLRFDTALSLYKTESSGLSRLFKSPPTDRLAGGDAAKAIATAARNYCAAVDAAVAVAAWLRDQKPPDSTTDAVAKAALTGPAIPDDADFAKLEAEVNAAWNATAQYRRVKDRIDDTLANVLDPSKEVNEAATAARTALRVADLTTDAGKKSVADAVTSLLTAIGTTPVREGIELATAGLEGAVNLRFAAEDHGSFYVDRVGETPAERVASVKTRNQLMEFGVAGLGGFIALLAAYGSLYVSNPAWGTAGDLVAAATWSVTAGSAVQVARAFSTRLAT